VGRMETAAILLEGAVETQNANDRVLSLLAQCKRNKKKEPQPSLLL